MNNEPQNAEANHKTWEGFTHSFLLLLLIRCCPAFNSLLLGWEVYFLLAGPKRKENTLQDHTWIVGACKSWLKYYTDSFILFRKQIWPDLGLHLNWYTQVYSLLLMNLKKNRTDLVHSPNIALNVISCICLNPAHSKMKEYSSVIFLKCAMWQYKLLRIKVQNIN